MPGVTATPVTRPGGWSVVSRTNESRAMGSLVNGAVPLRLVMVPCGSVSGLFSENVLPSSVPAS